MWEIIFLAISKHPMIMYLVKDLMINNNDRVRSPLGTRGVKRGRARGRAV